MTKRKYEEWTGNSLLPVGLFVKPSHPWLATTPDALVKDKKGNIFALKVRCPISCWGGKEILVPYLTRE